MNAVRTSTRGVFARDFIAGLAKKGKPRHQADIREEKIVGFSCTVALTDELGELMMHATALVDEETNALYVVMFESPANEWDSAWKTGSVMTGQFVIGTTAVHLARD